MASTLAPAASKRRRAITDAQRKALRDYYNEASMANKKQEHLVEWFNQRFNHDINQSTVSKILSPKFAHLSEPSSGSALIIRPQAKRHKAMEWPDLEIALWEWYQRMEKQGAPIIGDILRSIALSLWTKLPCYSGQPVTKFSTG